MNWFFPKTRLGWWWVFIYEAMILVVFVVLFLCLDTHAQDKKWSIILVGQFIVTLLSWLMWHRLSDQE